MASNGNAGNGLKRIYFRTEMNTEQFENLFSYGTLQQESVQKDTFGRLLDAQPDELIGFKLSMIEIVDKKVIASSGLAQHPIISQTNNAADIVKGVLLKVTTTELQQADDYEVDNYKRILVELKSGKKAWVYINASQVNVK
ncbi:gamma-glutamylcyclotransferase family protein [Pedobacter nototheniae]|uniref:gamma-glutamylcyclotransferase family protein n=1 Tax=Pedobacter nototheniae TaxID=2488994 RepID=UPI001FE5B8B1|nr:gamma-glutamylcyclotransferase family protein [Pedobacter nototheniae]